MARPQAIVAAPVAALDTDRQTPLSQTTLLGWVRGFLPDLRVQKQNVAVTQSLERLRQKHASADTDLGDDLHFSADK